MHKVLKKVSMLVAGPGVVCTYIWAMQVNTNVENGQLVTGASTVQQCQSACIINSSCTGFDWVAPSCWMSGPWSGQRNSGTAFSYVHFRLTRNCTGWEALLQIRIHTTAVCSDVLKILYDLNTPIQYIAVLVFNALYSGCKMQSARLAYRYTV